MLSKIKQCLKQLFCYEHDWKMFFIDYPDRCYHEKCRKCGKIVYTSMD